MIVIKSLLKERKELLWVGVPIGDDKVEEEVGREKVLKNGLN